MRSPTWSRIGLSLLTLAALACTLEPPTESSEGGAAGSASGAGGTMSSSTGGSAGASGSAGSSTTPGGAAGAIAAGGAGGVAGGAGRGGSGGSTGGFAGAGAGGAAAGSAGTGGSGAPLVPVTLYIAGDSTVSTYTDTASATDQAGWGQMLHEYFGELVTIENRAVGGRTARRFIDEGRLEDILGDLAEGDYFLVQFGTNDGNKSATYSLDGQTIPYYLDPATDFKAYLRQYVDGAREHGATPVLVTPPPRNSAYCTGGNGTGAHAEAMRELGEAEGVAVADLNQKTVDHLKATCPSPTPEDFFFVRADMTVDGTHFQENGARIMAGFVAAGIAESGLPLAAYLD